MDIILHLGAHRTATTSFQHYLRGRRRLLMRHRIGVWGPKHTRSLVFPGLFGNTRNAARVAEVQAAYERINLLMDNAAATGFETLLISDENLIGTCPQNLRRGRLYPIVGKRVRRLSDVFGTRLKRIVLSIRAQDAWWTSACALSFGKAHRFETLPDFESIAQSPRGWRQVITNIAHVAPQAELVVLPFEDFAGYPDAKLEAATGVVAQPDPRRRWLNGSQDLPGLKVFATGKSLDRGPSAKGLTPLPLELGRWQPFSPDQHARLRAMYREDLTWLAAGADGLAIVKKNTRHQGAGKSLPSAPFKKDGQDDKGQRKRRLARPG